MDTRPNKRQKRLVISSSDDDGDGKEDNANASAHLNSGSVNGRLQQPLPTRSKVTATNPSKKPSKTANPSLTRSSKTIVKNDSPKLKHVKGIARSITTFFDAKSAGQRPDGGTQASPRRSEETPSELLEDAKGEYKGEDLIEDDSPSENAVMVPVRHDTTRHVLDRRKQSHAVAGLTEKPLSASQRFKIPTGGAQENLATQKCPWVQEIDGRPWAERYGPSCLEELAVHKKKVTDVRMWLDNVLSDKDPRRLLVLKGPSGAGKTATLGLLAYRMNAELLEWNNPIGSNFSSASYSSMSAHFDDFLGRSGRFGKLDFSAKALQPAPVAPLTSEILPEPGRRKIIVLEEFPNIFQSTSLALNSFRSCIMEYLATSTPSMKTFNPDASMANGYTTPVVMIITETRLTTTTAASDSFTAHRLLGSDILSHPGVSVIEFNPIAPTFITKAMDLVLQKEARHSGRRRIPGPSVLKKLADAGDIRSAIGSLEFLCVKSNNEGDWSGRVAAKGKKGAQFSTILTEMEKESLEMLTQRESSLGLFHAIGKVVYNKRDQVKTLVNGEQYTVQPPQHLSVHTRKRTPQVSIDQLIDETGTDTGTFIAALHENYVISCECPSFVQSLNWCLDALSDVDILSSPRSGRSGIGRGTSGSPFQGAAADSLRHDEISFHLAVRGLLFALPDPVKRISRPSGRHATKSDAYKMLYPTSMRLSRQMEEIDHLVDYWVARLQPNIVTRPSFSQRRNAKADTVTATTSNDTTVHSSDQDPQEPHRTSLNVTRSELILERLPYICKIEQRRNNPSGHYRELESITQFHGIDVPADEDSTEENLPITSPNWTTDKPVKEAMHAVDSTALIVKAEDGVKHASNTILPVEEVEKLYLTDDDIEDD